MIDVQIILRKEENAQWLTECMQSLVSQPVRVHFGAAVEGNINAARIAVWDRCGGEFLSFVDPDDITAEGAFQACLAGVEEKAGVCTLENYLSAAGNVLATQIRNEDAAASPLYAHHLLVVRRSVYEAVRPLVINKTHGIEWALAVAAQELGGLVRLPITGYSWRRHPNQAFLQDCTPASYGKEIQRLVRAGK